MAAGIPFRREVVLEASGGTADSPHTLDPNAQTAEAAELRHLRIDRMTDGNRQTFGHNLVLIAKSAAAGGGSHVAGVTFDFVVWFWDSKNAEYYILYSTSDPGQSAVATRRLLATSDVREGAIVVQLGTITNPGATESVIARLCEI